MPKRSPREFRPFTIPDIYQDFADGQLVIDFLKEEPHFFFVGLPLDGHTIPIEIEEIPGIIAVLCDIANRAVDSEE